VKPSEHKVLSELKKQDPKAPWVDISQIMLATCLTYRSVYGNLTSLLKAGLVVEYPRESKGQHRYFADAQKEIEGIKPLYSSTQKVLGMIMEQYPEAPWVDIQQIMLATCLTYRSVYGNLISLLKAGLVVEYPRESKGQHLYFADAQKEIEGIKPLDSSTRKVLGMIMEQHPEAPWMDIQQIMEKTGLSDRTVETKLISLLKAGLVVEYPRESEKQHRYLAAAQKEIAGIKPLNSTNRKVLSVITGQNPRNPWVYIQQVMKKTGLSDRTVYRSLTSLLELGLVVEYPRDKEGQQHRYFADAQKAIEGIKPLNRTNRKVLGMITEQNPRNPWVYIQHIMEKTGLPYMTVYRSLISLLKAGLVVEYLQESKEQRRYFADAQKAIEGIKPLDRSTRIVLGMITEQDPENPWVDIQQIMEKTGLSDRTVYISLTSLIESGLVVEYPRETEGQKHRKRRYFADAQKEMGGIKPLERSSRKVLGAITEQNPENPWVDIQQIMEKTGLSGPTVYKSLTSLIESGLVVEYPRKSENHRRYFADFLKEVEGINPHEIRKKQDLEYIKVQLSLRESVLLAFFRALTRGVQWLKLEQIDHENLQLNQLSELLEGLIQDGLVKTQEGQYLYYALTPIGIRSAQYVNQHGRVQEQE
jgi:DNA-binding transcriptional ArsR family regulator